MRILWFTNTPSNASLEFGNSAYGGGWISSLESLITESAIHELGICFYYNGNSFKKVSKHNTIYYGLPNKNKSSFERILSRHVASLDDEDTKYIEKVIIDFNPSLIHVFGIENGFGKILMNHSIKTLFHLQGLAAPYADVFFPYRFNELQILINTKISSILRGITFLNAYWVLKKRGVREQEIVKHGTYFSGRTNWDRNYIQLINPKAKYFHCEEMLRKDFFLNEWTAPSNLTNGCEIVIGTTINPNLYKGLDVIYKVLYLLKGYKIRWKVFGIEENYQVNKVVKRILSKNFNTVNIEFYGQINAPSLIDNLKTCHFFVHPSYIDNSPNSVCEAMLLGMPVLSSSVGGIPTLVKNGETGFLYNPYDNYDLAGLLVNLIGDYEKAKFAGVQARQVALQRHSPYAIMTNLNEIYDSVLQDKS